MAREKKQRVATDASASAWTSPFAALDVHGRESTTGEPHPPPATEQSPPSKSERLLMRRETAHRGGKTVIILEGFSPAWNTARLEDLLHDLKRSLGCGGKIEGANLEIQGEQAERLQPLLEARNFSVKRGW